MRIRVTTRSTCFEERKQEHMSDRLFGRPVYENGAFNYGQVKFNTVQGQLADIGVTPEDITCLALSHSQFDHVGNANDFAGSIWLAQKAECDLRFETHAITQGSSDFAALAHARMQMIDADYDVFGDGIVILKYAPGHTPGHQCLCLYVKLSKSGLGDSFSVGGCSVKLRHGAFEFEISKQWKVELAIA